MPSQWIGRGVRVAAALVVAFGLMAGCTVRLVSDYDPQIDEGLSRLHTDVTAFVNRMIANAGKVAGTYDANKDFYTVKDAEIDTLIVRAEAHKALNSCPSTELVARAVTAAMPQSNAATLVSQIPKGDCSVVLLQLVKGGFGDLQKFHQAQGALGIPAAAKGPLLEGGLGSLIRAAIIVELAKRTGGSVGGNNGS
jgi:hypothetical protein